MPNISNLVKSIQDIMRKDVGTYGDAQRIEQINPRLGETVFNPCLLSSVFCPLKVKR